MHTACPSPEKGVLRRADRSALFVACQLCKMRKLGRFFKICETKRTAVIAK